MTSSELIAVMASSRTGTEGNSDLWLATRTLKTLPFGPFEAADGLPNINTGAEELDPELSADGLHLYLTEGNPRRIAISVRSNTNGNFGSPQDVAGLFSDAGDADPSVSPDELVIVFSSRRNGSSTDELWYATRASKTAAFGTPALVPAINSGGNDEADPALSPDGCRLYFASDRGGNFELFVAEMIP
jgi:Tol biopolymer transport system component